MMLFVIVEKCRKKKKIKPTSKPLIINIVEYVVNVDNIITSKLFHTTH